MAIKESESLEPVQTELIAKSREEQLQELLQHESDSLELERLLDEAKARQNKLRNELKERKTKREDMIRHLTAGQTQLKIEVVGDPDATEEAPPTSEGLFEAVPPDAGAEEADIADGEEEGEPDEAQT